MADEDFLGSGLHSPISLQDGKMKVSKGDDLIRESILIILGTAKGERVMRPDFGCGINELVFAPNDVSTATLLSFHIKEALLQWEPRIDVLDISVQPDSTEQNRLNINISYKVKATNTKKNLVFPFYLEVSQ